MIGIDGDVDSNKALKLQIAVDGGKEQNKAMQSSPSRQAVMMTLFRSKLLRYS